MDSILDENQDNHPISRNYLTSTSTKEVIARNTRTIRIEFCTEAIDILEEAGCRTDGFDLPIPSTATMDDVFTEITTFIRAPKWALKNVRTLFCIFIFITIYDLYLKSIVLGKNYKNEL